MIREAYCSFEVSKLLKEKGFDGKCKAFYEPPCKRLCEIRWEPKPYISYSQYENTDHIILSPSLAMAMSWLREEHNIHCTIDIGYSSKTVYFSNIFSTKKSGALHNETGYYNSYEEAVEAALLYTLKKLI